MVQPSHMSGERTNPLSHIPVAPTEHRALWQQETMGGHCPRSLLPTRPPFLWDVSLPLWVWGGTVGSHPDFVVMWVLIEIVWDFKGTPKACRRAEWRKAHCVWCGWLVSSSCKIWPHVEEAERQLVRRSAETPDAAAAARPPAAAWRGRAADSNLQHLGQRADGTTRRPQQLHRRAHPRGEQGRLCRQQLLPGHTAFPGPVRSWYQWNQTRTNMWLHTSIRLLSLLFLHQWRDFSDCVHGRTR